MNPTETEPTWSFVECPMCAGRRGPVQRTQQAGDRHPIERPPVCPTCRGDGKIWQQAKGEREIRLGEPHVAPLMDLVQDLRSHGYDVPNFDPYDGGVNAKVLFLSETPGPMAVASSYVSRDNPDPSAKNMGKALDAAGFARSDVVLWNVVPYCVSSVDKNRHATGQQIRDAAVHTQAFINRLPNLRAVVFCGRQAQRAMAHVRLPDGVQALATFHSGAQSFNRPHCREHIIETCNKAHALASSPSL